MVFKIETYWDHINRCIGCDFCTENSELGPLKGCPLIDTFSFLSHGPKGRLILIKSGLNSEITIDKKIAERIFECTDCGFCEEHCMGGLPLVDIWYTLREELTRRDLTPNAARRETQILEKTKNIYGKSHDGLVSWIKDKSIIDKQADTVFFVGCVNSYEDQKTGQTIVDLLKKIGEDFTVLSDEWCCGYPLTLLGHPDKAITFMEHNIDLFKKVGAKKILFQCPGCMASFTRLYPKLTGKSFPFKAIHITEFLNDFVIKNKGLEYLLYPLTVTYHDPCHLARRLKIVDEPRNILKGIPNLRLLEMERTKKRTYCCGGTAITSKEVFLEASKNRIEEALSTGADLILTECPTCKITLKKAAKRLGAKIDIKNISELINEII